MANPSHLTPAQMEKLRAKLHQPSQAPVHSKSKIKVPNSTKVHDYDKVRAAHKTPAQAPTQLPKHRRLTVPTTHADLQKLQKLQGERRAPAQAKSLIRIPK